MTVRTDPIDVSRAGQCTVTARRRDRSVTGSLCGVPAMWNNAAGKADDIARYLVLST